MTRGESIVAGGEFLPATFQAFGRIGPVFHTFGTSMVNSSTSFKFLLPLLLLLIAGAEVSAQYQKRVIQLSGVVIGSDSSRAIPGVHVYVPKAGRGDVTNNAGFFSMPVLVGDSVVISAVGFVRQHYIVPPHPSDFLTLIIEKIGRAHV